MINRFFRHSFVRFLLVGCINTLVGLSVIYLLLNLAGLNYWISTLLGNCIGAACSYLLNRKFTFRSNANVAVSLWKFLAVTIASYFLSYWISLQITQAAFLRAGLRNASFLHNVSVLLGSVFYTLMNYFGHRFFTFHSRTDQPTLEVE